MPPVQYDRLHLPEPPLPHHIRDLRTLSIGELHDAAKLLDINLVLFVTFARDSHMQLEFSSHPVHSRSLKCVVALNESAMRQDLADLTLGRFVILFTPSCIILLMAVFKALATLR